MEKERKAPLTNRLELQTRVYTRFVKLLPEVSQNTEIDPEKRLPNQLQGIVSSPGYFDKLSGTLKSDTVVIFFAKGKNAGRITLFMNSHSKKVHLISSQKYEKAHEIEGEGKYSMIAVKGKPDLSAVDSLIARTEKIMRKRNKVRVPIEQSDLFTESKHKKHTKIISILLARINKMNNNTVVEEPINLENRQRELMKLILILHARETKLQKISEIVNKQKRKKLRS